MTTLHRPAPAVHSNPPTGQSRTLPADRRAAWSEFEREWGGLSEAEVTAVLWEARQDAEFAAWLAQQPEEAVPADDQADPDLMVAFSDWLDHQAGKFEAVQYDHRADWLGRELRKLAAEARDLMVIGPDGFDARRESAAEMNSQRDYERGFEDGRRHYCYRPLN